MSGPQRRTGGGAGSDRRGRDDRRGSAGEKSAYIEQTLQAYRSGNRSQPIMQQQAALLTDSQIAELAAYYSSQTGLVVK